MGVEEGMLTIAGEQLLLTEQLICFPAEAFLKQEGPLDFGLFEVPMGWHTFVCDPRKPLPAPRRRPLRSPVMERKALHPGAVWF